MENIITTTCKLSHKQFRAMLKKFRRKKIRQKLAKEIEEKEILEQKIRENSPGYKERQEEIRRNSELYDQFEERERIRQHKLWLLREQQAQAEFKRRQEKLELERIKNEEERKRILEEFEKQEYVIKQAEDEIKKMKSKKEEALQEALANINEADRPWHNPIAPENYKIGQERDQCMFFSKTGCCRFGERCSRGHTRSSVSCTILIKGMYSHFSIDQTGRDDYDTDIALEYEDKEKYQDFKNFYNDVLPEFRKYGKVIQFKVCNNFEPHLRGNVYVQYSREEEAVEAYKNFNGRFYAGKQITCEFTHVVRWRAAICGLHSQKLCPKGMNCNFLHVFRNPNDEFWEANIDLPPREKHRNSNSSRNRGTHGRRYESRSDRNESRSYRSESRYERRESRNDNYEPRTERHSSRKDRFEPSSERNEYRNHRYETLSDRHESRSDRLETSSNRYESRNDRLEASNGRYESRSDRNDSRNNRYDNYYKSGSSSDSYDDDDDYNYSSRHKETIKDRDRNSRHKKRSRSSSSSSGSNSSSNETSHNKKSHKNKKHKKKKSKKRKKHECAPDDSAANGTV